MSNQITVNIDLDTDLGRQILSRIDALVNPTRLTEDDRRAILAPEPKGHPSHLHVMADDAEPEEADEVSEDAEPEEADEVSEDKPRRKIHLPKDLIDGTVVRTEDGDLVHADELPPREPGEAYKPEEIASLTAKRVPGGVSGKPRRRRTKEQVEEDQAAGLDDAYRVKAKENPDWGVDQIREAIYRERKEELEKYEAPTSPEPLTGPAAGEPQVEEAPKAEADGDWPVVDEPAPWSPTDWTPNWN